MYVLVSVMLVAMTFFIMLDGVNIVKSNLQNKWVRFRKLNKFVSSRYKGFKIILVSFEIIFRSLYLSFIQWLNDSVKQIDKYRYEISYVIKGRLYKIIVKPVGGPSPILLATDENGNDILDDIFPYVGVSHDFHGYKFTPQFFGCKSINIETANGENIEFDETEPLRLDN